MITTRKRKTATKARRNAVKATAPKRKLLSRKVRSYDKLKDFQGKKYTGMAIGRSHKWVYDPGDWKESKITPDLWEFSFIVTKRRAYTAPVGSGAAIGTGYHWYILGHQNVFKLNANDYSTSMTGLKFKVAHKRASKGTWNISAKAQRKRIITCLKKTSRPSKESPYHWNLNSRENQSRAKLSR
jgi:hypothetical protein